MPLKHLCTRLVVPQGFRLYSTALAGDTPASHSVVAGMDVYQRDLSDVPAVIAEQNLAFGETAYAQTIYSSYKDWAAVGNYFAPIYDISHAESEAVNTVAASIRDAFATDEDRVIAALDFVQKEVRYLGIELGAGGYIPRAPQLVIDRRFGDCKDMTVLLIAILNKLDIKALPVLVSQQNRAGVALQQPTHSAFDHVITQVTLGTKTYFLDPTRGEQLGDLEHRQQGDFGKGVVIAENSPGMIDVVSPRPDFYKVIVDTFTTTPGSNEGAFESVTDQYMASADELSGWLKSGGLADISRSYLQYYQNTFPGITETKPLTVEVFEEDAHVRVTANYHIPTLWDVNQNDSNIRTLWVRPYEINAAIPQFNGTDRKSDYAIGNPVRISHEIKVLLDDSWELDVENLTFDHPAFRIEKRQRFTNNILSTVYTYVTKSDHIKAADFTLSMASIGNVLDYSGVYLTDDSSFLSNLPDWDFESVYLGYIVAIIIASRIGVYLTRNRDLDWRDKQVFYPVGLPKLLVLTAVTLGLYQIFWVYKNWQWVRDVQEEQISPFWRAFFSSITNFSLYPRLSKTEQLGYSWFGPIAIPLAVLVLLSNVLERYIEKQLFVPLGLQIASLLTMFLFVPAAMQALRLNADNPEAVRLNSKFSLGNYLVIAAGLPILLLAVMGTLDL